MSLNKETEPSFDRYRSSKFSGEFITVSLEHTLKKKKIFKSSHFKNKILKLGGSRFTLFN